jgi:hypothetical protein
LIGRHFIFKIQNKIQDWSKSEDEAKPDKIDLQIKDEDLVKKQVYDLACKINTNLILKNNELNKNNLGTKLNSIIHEVYSSNDESFESSLTAFRDFLIENNDFISSYELSISEIVSLLMFILNSQDQSNSHRKTTFMKIFDDGKNGLKILIHKLVLLLESIERLPLYLYDAPYTYNLQVFSKRFKLVLNCGGIVDGDDRLPASIDEQNKNVLNFTGRVLKVEPLANVSHLEKYLSKMVAKHWFDFDRKGLFYLNIIEEVVAKGNYLPEFHGRFICRLHFF